MISLSFFRIWPMSVEELSCAESLMVRSTTFCSFGYPGSSNRIGSPAFRRSKISFLLWPEAFCIFDLPILFEFDNTYQRYFSLHSFNKDYQTCLLYTSPSP